ncbi:aldehyde dehydrogenase (NADP(+)) [Nesterenkonia massiliensis]|uniref:aldehyde dehydrogenase (NADP(+)) n=1 Tax=Nesterenkonia massiliensis TaxID=1232429 RepID=UPI00040B4E22|nr:aldehyde dehydrogenase (NADP(+)) [Nesterenkonia massiliensis]
MTTTLTEKMYHSLIGGKPVEGTSGTTQAINPATNEATGPEFTLISEDQTQQATLAAAEAFPTYRRLTPKARAQFLNAAADKIQAAGEQIIATAMTETGLPEPRLQGELARTVNQLRLFAKVAGQADYLGVRIEPAMPERKPLPRPDLRQVKIPLGPVAVFGASNFPLAFSVAGGDTASALAAGCPVVFKAHNAHPGTSQLVGAAISEAVAEEGLPAGVFSLVYGRGTVVGQALVADPHIKAVGFTGSRGGGTALMATAAARPQPIPVYAEMSSINPIFVLATALGKDDEALAEGFVTSLTGSAGQLCTAPGLLFVPEGPAGDDFVERVSAALTAAAGSTMLTPGICSSRVEGEEAWKTLDGVTEVARGTAGSTENAPAPAVYTTDVATFLSTKELSEEIFGSVCLIVRYGSEDELHRVATGIEGQLTATLHLDPARENLTFARAFVEDLELKVGRVLVNGWPTGVDVGDAMVHGGPFPATSDGRSTSVGTLAIDRFLRPVAYQNLPADLLPDAVRDENPWSVVRRMDGQYTLPSIEGDA